MEARAAVHPFADLNAYIDGALDPQSRERVDGHLASCAACRTRVAQLRATAGLIAGLPTPAPARSLIPRVSVPFWLAPIRAASVVASGLALIVFVISLGSGSATPTSGAAGPTLQRNDQSGAAASSQPVLAPAPSAAQASPGAAFSVGGSTTPNPAERTTVDTQTQKAAGPAGTTPTPASAQASTGPQARALHVPANLESSQSPVIWLVLAIAFGAIAIFTTWRLRAA